jgi:protein-S-isoprenylcysteine O-methyltransferase Ste14
MGRISGTMAVLAGIFMLLPGVFVMMGSPQTSAPMPGWIVRDLVLFSLSGIALLVWGGFVIRRRELEINALEPIRVRARR